MKSNFSKAAFLAALPMMLATGCSTHVEDTEETLETVRATQQSLFDSIAADDLRGAVRNYTEDATIVTPDNTRTQGAAEIEAWFAEFLEDPNLKIEAEPGPGWAATSGDMAVTTSKVQFTRTNPETGEVETVPMSNQSVWRRPQGGVWQIASEYLIAVDDGGVEVAEAE